MSTKAIRKALDMIDTSFQKYTEEADARTEALAEVAAIELAAKALADSGDCDHPDVAVSQEALRKNDAALDLMKSIARDAP